MASRTNDEGSDFSSSDGQVEAPSRFRQQSNAALGVQQQNSAVKNGDGRLSNGSNLNLASGEVEPGSLHGASVAQSANEVQKAKQVFRSECQNYLESDFLEVFKEKAGNKRTNDRDFKDTYEDQPVEHSHDDLLNKLKMFEYNAPEDAYSTKKIKTLEEYIRNCDFEMKNPKTSFFDLSGSYYTGKYKDQNKREIIVKSYLITADYQNYVKDLSMEIIQTHQGCMPVIKTFEYNAYDSKRFVKAIKFYNYRGDCELKKQIIVDEGQMCKEFRTYDTSLLHFENSIIFYKREDKWHKLNRYDVTTGEQFEIPGYNIEEDVGKGIRLHIIFSSHFGGQNRKMKNTNKYNYSMDSGDVPDSKQAKEDFRLHQFLSQHYVFCQQYQITEELQYINLAITGFRMHREWADVVREQKRIEAQSKEQANKLQEDVRNRLPALVFERAEHLKHPIQQVCHILVDNEPEDENAEPETTINFVAFDSFQSHHFHMKHGDNQSRLSKFTTYFGNNETHLHDEIMAEICNQNMTKEDDNRMHEDPTNRYSPFLKHTNAQFTIQKERITIQDEAGNDEVINQYFYLTNDNQYMLVYPNYGDTKDISQRHKTKESEAHYNQQMQKKKDVIMQLAQRFQYNPNPDIDYNYDDDFNLRRSDYLAGIYKKVSHICINDYNSKNHIKRARHIEKILKRSHEGPDRLTIWDDVILSTDEQTNLIYIFQPKAERQSENKIEIYFYENNIVNTNDATTLPTQIYDMERILDDNLRRSEKMLEYCFDKKRVRTILESNSQETVKKILKDRQLQLEKDPEYEVPKTTNEGMMQRKFKELSEQQVQSVLDFRFKQQDTTSYQPHTTFYINAAYKDVVSTPHLIHTIQKSNLRVNLDWLREYDPGMVMQIEENMLTDKDCDDQFIPLSCLMPTKFREDHIFVESPTASYLCLKVKPSRMSGKIMEEKITLEMYTRNKKYYTFFFSIQAQKTQKGQVKPVMNIIYFAVRKTINQVMELGQNNNDQIIPDEKTDVIMFEANAFASVEERFNLEAYTQDTDFKTVLEEVNSKQDVRVHLTFEKCMDSRTNLDFVPMIYQLRKDKLEIGTHHLISFDISSLKVVRHFPMLPNLQIRERLRTVGDNIGVYTITRTSDVFNQALGFMAKKDASEQVAKYQVAAQFSMQSKDKKVNQEKAVEQPSNCTIEFLEFAIHYSSHDQNRIQLIGIKQMLISQSAINERKKTFDKLFVVPWVDSKQKLKGSQFVLRERIDEQPLQVIRMIDQNINKLYQHQNETIQYGHQKFLTSKDTHEDYILVISSQLKQRVYMGHFFENSETYFIHHKVIKKLLSMKLAKFEYYVLNDDFEALMREEFYQSQEVLQGKTINDLCLGFPREVAQGLKQPKSQYQKITGSLIEEVSNGEQSLIDQYLGFDLCDYNLLIQMDFNFTSSLRIAAELNSNQAVKQIMAKIFQMNDLKYQDIFMMETPRMLQLPRIERFYDFLTRDYAEKRVSQEEEKKAALGNNNMIQSNFLNMEDSLNHPKLPHFLSKPVNYHIKYRFQDHHNENQEIVNEMVDLKRYDEIKVKSIKTVLVPRKLRKKVTVEMEGTELRVHNEKKRKEEEQKNVEVEHTAINFTKVIIGEKIRHIQEHDYRHVNFNDNHLASIFWVEDEEHLDFYDLEAVRKIIDFQFVRTKEFIQFIMAFYVLGFLIPYIISLNSTNLFFLNIFYILMLFTQIFFMIFEGMQVKEQKWDYLKDPWNIIDSTQFIMFFTLYCIKMKNQFQTDSIMEILLQSAILLQSFGRMIYFVRVFESFNVTYLIMHLVARDVYCLGIIAAMFLLSFTKQFTVMHYGVNDPDGEFKGLGDSMFLKLAIQSYKSAKGQVSVPSLDDSMTKRTDDTILYRDIMKGLNMGVWIIQEGVFIFLGALFFSHVYQYAEKWYPKIETYMYKSKAKFNNECYDIVDMFVPQRNFKAICFSMAKQSEKSQQWRGPTKKILEIVQEDYQKKLFDNERDQDLGDQRHKTLTDMKSTVTKLKSQIETIYSQVKEQ